MVRVPGPARRTFNATLVAGPCGAYLNGGFGPWELVYPLLATPVVYAALRSYRFIGIAFIRSSSWGCMIFDAIIAIWFLAGALALIGRRAQASQTT